MRDRCFIRPAIYDGFDVVCAVSTRNGSSSPYDMNMSYHVGDREERVAENRRRFFSALNIPEGQLASQGQVHSAAVSVARSPGFFGASDALVTDRPGVWLVVTVADCVPVFLADPKHGVIAAVHAGWRGSEQAIVSKTVTVMTSDLGARTGDIRAFIGPSAGVCCYEVGDDVGKKFSVSVVSERGRKLYLDLKKENSRQLKSAGLMDRNIEISPLCTICSGDILHSYRRDGERSGRMIGVIGRIDHKASS